MADKAKPRKADKRAKKRAKKAAGKAAHSLAALPKRLAGIKVPKALRRSGSTLVEFAQSDLGRAVLAAALTGAADALTRHRSASAGQGAHGAGGAEAGAAVTAKDVVQSAAAAAAGVVKEAAKTVLPPALMGEPDASRGSKRERSRHGSSQDQDGSVRG